MNDLLLDQIYEAAVLPELWPDVLTEIGKVAGAWGAALFIMERPHSMNFAATENYRPCIEKFVTVADQANNPRPQRALERKHAGFLSDLDLCTIEELQADPIYTRMLYPSGISWTAGTVITVPSGDFLIFDIVKSSKQTPFEKAEIAALDKLRPDLARAALLSARLGLQRACNTVDVLDAIGLPAALLNRSGRVVAENSLFEQVMGPLQITAYDRFRFKDKSKDQILQHALHNMENNQSTCVKSIPVTATEETTATILHILPIRRAAHDIFNSASVLLIATPVLAPNAPMAELLHGLFDLTASEARVARSLAGGTTLTQIASQLGLSRETVRTQLKSVLAKTGTSRQSELVGLLSSTTSLPLRRN